MSELQQFIGEDSRKPIQRLRRCQLHKIADGFKLQYPPGATKDVMIMLFEANNIDVTQSPEILWQGAYPAVEQQPASIRNNVNATAGLNERLSAKEEEEQGFDKARISALERELDQARKTNEQLQEVLEKRLAALEDKKPADPDSSPANSYWATYRKAREMGLDVDRCMKLPQIEAAIEKER